MMTRIRVNKKKGVREQNKRGERERERGLKGKNKRVTE